MPLTKDAPREQTKFEQAIDEIVDTQLKISHDLASNQYEHMPLLASGLRSKIEGLRIAELILREHFKAS